MTGEVFAWRGYVPGTWDDARSPRFVPLAPWARYSVRCVESIARRRWAGFVAGGGLWTLGTGYEPSR